MEEQPKVPMESVPGATHTLRHNQYEVDVYKLISLTKELPATSVELKEYDSELDDPCWTDTNEQRVTPREVIALYKDLGPAKAAEIHPNLTQHLQQLEHADYSHPILIFESKIIDGSHRFAKAYIDGQSSIQAKILTEIPGGAVLQLHPKD